MKEWAEKFYNSEAWRRRRKKYMNSVNGLCERCMKKNKLEAAVIVHHKKHLTPKTINNPMHTLATDNLEALCMNCHNAEHHKTQPKYKIDESGMPTLTMPPHCS